MIDYLKMYLVVVAAMVSVLVGYEWYKKPSSKDYFAAANIVEGISVAGRAKVHVAMYYEIASAFPSSNQDLGLPSPEKFIGQSLTSLRVSEGGVITLTYNSKSGIENGVIQLTPSISPAMGIQWKCSTPSYKTIIQIMPTCEYVK